MRRDTAAAAGSCRSVSLLLLSHDLVDEDLELFGLVLVDDFLLRGHLAPRQTAAWHDHHIAVRSRFRRILRDLLTEQIEQPRIEDVAARFAEPLQGVLPVKRLFFR